MTDHTPMQLEKYYTCYIERRLYNTLQPRFCKVDYRLVNIEYPNSTQEYTILMMILCRDVASGIDKHPDRTEIYFSLQIQGNRRLIPCSRTFK